MKRLERFFPPGYNKSDRDIILISVMAVTMLLIAMIIYCNRFNDFYGPYCPDPLTTGACFNDCIRGMFGCFWIYVAACVIWALMLKGYFKRRSRSDYLMKRLESGAEMTKRWLLLPLAAMLAGFVICVAAVLLMRLSFNNSVDPKYLVNGQGKGFWTAFVPGQPANLIRR